MKRDTVEPATAEIVASIGKITNTRTLELHFEMVTDGKAVGFGRTFLRPQGSGSYQYEAEIVYNLGEGARIEGWAKATLNASLEPVEVEARRELVAPNGNRKSTLRRAEIQSNEVLVTLEEDGAPATQQIMPRPQSPFVFALEFLVQRIDLERFPAFSLREFDVQDRAVKNQHFRVESGPNGIRRLVSRKDDGSIGYVFEVDAKGGLVSWAEPPLPVVSKTCSPERFEEMRKSMGR